MVSRPPAGANEPVRAGQAGARVLAVGEGHGVEVVGPAAVGSVAVGSVAGQFSSSKLAK
ncbi:hypothetical protein [Streptomyces sp. Da 82-17]|uniref:hypothetical protein n=1 Tax=Streptomyces sp. Da 82-17 TaxID=3377116 RepID=UPI0038D3FE80